MEITVLIFLLLMLLAFVCEFIDSSVGMGYGTILSPVLIILGFNPLVAIPAVLLSQAIGGFTASVFHHQFDNANFNRGSRDLNIVMIISGAGILATIIAALISINIPKIILKSYIGIMVLIMGIIILINKKFTFSWKKIIGLGIISSFNKGMSGGGFGPIVTGGQVLSGQKHKNAIGATTFAEAPICITAFFAYLIGRTVTELQSGIWNMPFREFITEMFSREMFQWELISALILGSILVAPFGAFTTRKLPERKMHIILGILVSVLGIWTLIKIFIA